MNEKTILYESKNTVLDSESGEVVETIVSSVSRVPQTPDFVMAFTQDMAYLSQISGGAAKLLFGLIQVVDRNNEITLNMARKKTISLKTGLKIKSIDALLSQLVKKEVVLRADRGIYMLNPYLFGKGQWKNISKIRMTMEYNFDELTKTVEYENHYKVDTDDPINLIE